MSDLISRKALMRKLFFAEDGRKYPTRDIDNFPTTITFEDLRKVIRNEPTAYDVDKVVEQIEKRKVDNIRVSKLQGNSHTKKIAHICRSDEDDYIIKIVKGGGQG